jgi:hypothetical protein
MWVDAHPRTWDPRISVTWIHAARAATVMALSCSSARPHRPRARITTMSSKVARTGTIADAALVSNVAERLGRVGSGA